MKRIIEKNLHNKLELDDVYQECCLKLCSRLHYYDKNISKLSTFVYYLTLHTCKDFNKLNYHIRNRMEDCSIEDIDIEVCEQEILTDLEHDIIKSKLSKLPELDRKLVELRIYDGLTYQQIAEELNFTKQYAEKRLKKILYKLGRK